MVRISALGAVVAALVMTGCSSGGANVSTDGSNVTVTGPDGTKTTSQTGSDGGSNVTVTAANGEQATMSTDKNGSISVKGPDGNVSMGGNTSVTEADLGVPFYPGSTEKAGASMKVETSTEKDYLSVRTTSDDHAKVGEFYKGKVKGSTFVTTGEMTIVTGLLESGAKFSMTATKKDSVTEISVGVGVKIK